MPKHRRAFVPVMVSDPEITQPSELLHKIVEEDRRTEHYAKGGRGNAITSNGLQHCRSNRRQKLRFGESQRKLHPSHSVRWPPFDRNITGEFSAISSKSGEIAVEWNNHLYNVYQSTVSTASPRCSSSRNFPPISHPLNLSPPLTPISRLTTAPIQTVEADSAANSRSARLCRRSIIAVIIIVLTFLRTLHRGASPATGCMCLVHFVGTANDFLCHYFSPVI